MGCFLACFGSSKDKKRRNQRYKVQPRDLRNARPYPVPIHSVRDCSEKPINSVREVRPEEHLSLSTRRKVTFDSNVRTYEHVSQEDVADYTVEKEAVGEKEEENSSKSIQSPSPSERSSITSSSGSYPPNHRYQNCRESDDEYEESDCEGDLDDDDDNDDDGALDFDDFYEDSNDEIVGSRTLMEEEVDGSMLVSGLQKEEVKSIALDRNARDRSAYVHSVLNPVENLSQWRAVIAKGTPPLKPKKENFTSNQEPRIPFSTEPSLKELSFSFKSKKDDKPRKLDREVAVDASLSNWLSSTETTPSTKTSTIALGSVTPEKSISQGSNSFVGLEDRPILGALTLEEIKQFSASNSPRRSPSKSPDEMPLIGTVGTYWSHTSSIKDSGSASSYKGIPNTTSKYREDKRVNWHSTPFETRLERALNGGGAAEACSARTPSVF